MRSAISRDGGVILGGGTADNSNNGAVWVFGRTGVASWEQQNSKYVASDAGSGAQFGSALGISADANTAIFGAANETSGAGAIWAYNDNIFFGSVNVSASTTQTIAIQPQSNFTIGNVIVSTQGFGQLDFSIAASQTASHVCEIDSDINSGTPTCSLTIKFAPTAPACVWAPFKSSTTSQTSKPPFTFMASAWPRKPPSSPPRSTPWREMNRQLFRRRRARDRAEMNSTWGVMRPRRKLVHRRLRKRGDSLCQRQHRRHLHDCGNSRDRRVQRRRRARQCRRTIRAQNPIIDGAGNLYIDDYPNQKIRVVNSVSQFISAYAGNGTAANAGDGGLAVNAEFNGPYAVMIGNNGDAYIAVADVVRRVSAITGIITTVAGAGASGYSGDGGPATSARLNLPKPWPWTPAAICTFPTTATMSFESFLRYRHDQHGSGKSGQWRRGFLRRRSRGEQRAN